MDNVKQRMNKAFRYMRGEGLFARQNYLCCGGCAGLAASHEIRERQAKGKTILGACYTTQQDVEVFKDENVSNRAYEVASLSKLIAMTNAGLPLPARDDMRGSATSRGSQWYSLPFSVRSYIRNNLREDGTLCVGKLATRIEEISSRCKIYIGFGGVEQPDGTEIETIAVGRIVQECLTRAGIESVWEGITVEELEMTRIRIPLLQPLQEDQP